MMTFLHENTHVLTTREMMDIHSTKESGEMKQIEGKVRYDLIPAESMELFARAMEYGARQHVQDDWREGKGMPWSWLLGAVLRHTWAVLRGEDLDRDSRLPHMAHVMASAAMLLYYWSYPKRYDKDDRFQSADL
jgi:hypothetical protein